jgi:hypothetical protein
MTFQFLCPQGHLLEGDESQMGQACDCPMCGMRFLIPMVAGYQQAAAPSPFDFAGGRRSEGNPFALPEPEEEPEPEVEEEPVPSPLESNEPKLLHIPCPNGHELETPEEMLGQEVLCPFCGEQFELRYKDSVEHKREKAIEREMREVKTANMWFNWAIVVAVIVLGGLVFMILMQISSD